MFQSVCLPVSVCLFVYLSICVSLQVRVCVSVCLSIYLWLSVCPCVCLCACLSVCVSVYLYVSLSLCLFLYVFMSFVCLCVCVSVFLSVSLCVCLSVCLFYLSVCLSMRTVRQEWVYLSAVRRYVRHSLLQIISHQYRLMIRFFYGASNVHFFLILSFIILDVFI